LTVLQGSGLVAKDRNLFGKKTSSDPYIEVWTSSNSISRVGKTATKKKTLEPKWNQTFEFKVKPQNQMIYLKIFDEDLLSAPDAMGTVTIRIPSSNHNEDTTQWYDVPPDSAKNASGKIQVRLQTTIVQSRTLVRGNAFELKSHKLQIGLAWDMVQGKAVDLDVSCVAISRTGQFVLQDTVYYANTSNSNRSVVHSGDEKEGEEEGDDESIYLELDKVPSHILVMYIVLTVATPNMRIPDIRSTTMRVYDVQRVQNRLTLCTFAPASHVLSRDATAMFMVRIARSSSSSSCWIMSPIEDTHPTARDFGSLVPYLKSYTRDLLPSIHVDPTERAAILRKGGTVRLADYCPGGRIPNAVTFGLAWDMTNDKNVDLDASCICLDANFNLVDLVFWSHLKSNDGSIHHHGDEREGDEIGDDEKISLHLNKVDSRIQYIGFVINSYSGEELDDVARASCHLFDPQTNSDMASYAMTDSSSLDGYTALVVACLFRDPATEGWCLCILSQPAHGKLAQDNVETLSNSLRRNPPRVPPMEEEHELEIVVGMPDPIPLVDEEIDLSGPP
jgi:tellurium resistance protein TerZ